MRSIPRKSEKDKSASLYSAIAKIKKQKKDISVQDSEIDDTYNDNQQTEEEKSLQIS